MKCPECGQWNRASMPHCINCGARLNIDVSTKNEWRSSLKDNAAGKEYIRVDDDGEAFSEPDARDVLAREMHELKKRKKQGTEALDAFRRNTGSAAPAAEADKAESAPEAPAVQYDPTADTAELRLQAEAEAARRRRISREELLAQMNDRQKDEFRSRVRIMDENGAWLEGRGYDYVPDDQSVYSAWINASTSSAASPIVPPSRIRRLKATVRALAIILAVVLLVVGGWFVWNGLSNRQTQNIDPERQPIITASLLDDLAAHTIKIPGEDGTQIYVRELHASYLVTEGYATIEVADHTWYDNYVGLLEEEMEVSLTPFLKTASGKQVPLDIIHYNISIPISPIVLDTPDALRTEVATTMSAIKIFVRPGSTVTVNGEDYSDTVSSSTGEMSYNATVQPIGDNKFEIVVRSQYCRDNTLTVTLYREPQEIPLDLAAGTYGTTNSKTMKVTATTLPGAYVDVESPYGDLDISELDATGKFTFNAVFDHIGDNKIIINATYGDKKPSRVEHTVYYLPPATEYTTKAWPLDEAGYSELLSNITYRAEHSQVYLVTGVVQYSVSDKPQMVVINTSPDGKSQPVLVQNYTKTNWEVGNYYRIYADANSTYNSMPWLNARYTYEK